jgi:hydrogenase nickel incorporation protein HypA/HybF
MHELAITEQILDIATRHGEQAGAERVTDLYLVIGDLSSIIDDSVQLCWDMINEGTICEGAQLHFERIPAKLKCRQCGTIYTLENGELTPCPECESIQIDVIQGKEFRLDSINIEEKQETSKR